MKKLNNILQNKNKGTENSMPVIFYNSELIENIVAQKRFDTILQFTNENEYINFYREDNYVIFSENIISKIL